MKPHLVTAKRDLHPDEHTMLPTRTPGLHIGRRTHFDLGWATQRGSGWSSSVLPIVDGLDFIDDLNDHGEWDGDTSPFLAPDLNPIRAFLPVQNATYQVSEPVQVGPIPERSELTVEVPEGKPLGFYVYESPAWVYRIPPKTDFEAPDFDGQAFLEAATNDDNRIPATEPLKPGDRILCPTLVGWGIGTISPTSRSTGRRWVRSPTLVGWGIGTIQTDGSAMSPSGQTAFFLDNKDENFWWTPGSGNMKAIQKLKLHR